LAHTLMNDRTRSAVALEVEVAANRAARRRGLLGRDSMAATQGLLLSPCIAIHTAFMRFPIDVIFTNRDGRAVHIARDLQPWRIAVCLRGHAVIELAAGTAAAADIQVGDLLYLAPAPPPRRREIPIKPDSPHKGDVPRTPDVTVKRERPLEEHHPC
jgi:uncharacterized membrane protein (UPF0127 family)